ncbi:MAG: hypothetical protein A2Y58_01175 [Chloroflexi bacterium RBG_13_51_52]|nr:MAG: hypothetical protein A2Y58_01175 [Chloroflexi bacterium RBG_13_51_52]
MEEKIVYFEKPGIENTETTLKLALERANARGIKKVVMASTRGSTASLAAKNWAKSGIKIVVIPHQFGFMGAEFSPEMVKELEKQGHTVHFGTMLFHTERFYGMNTPTIMANLLRTFCQGMKVCVEILLMAADGGHVDIGEQVVVVSGSGRGADTAVVALATTSTHLADLHITEIICKPLQTKQGPPPSAPPQGAPPPDKKPA